MFTVCFIISSVIAKASFLTHLLLHGQCGLAILGVSCVHVDVLMCIS